MLNPTLYGSLVDAVQRGYAANGLAGKKVKVIRQGQSNQLTYPTDPRTGRTYAKILTEGEVYQVCCPFCQDTRFRLNINHAWGLKSESGTRNYFMAHCFNEHCEHLEGFSQRLEYRLGGYLTMSAALGLQVQQDGQTVVREKREPFPPGPCIPLEQLPPTHPANKLMLDRGYDPYKIAPKYGLSYCFHSKFVQAQNRIIFPVTQNGALRGWQARFVDAHGGGSVAGLWVCKQCGYVQAPSSDVKYQECPLCHCEDIGKAAKYWTMPTMSTGENLMNYDWAVRYNFVVVCEGPMDVLRVAAPHDPHEPGPAVCIFGHTLGSDQKRLLFERWSSGYVVLLLDQDAYKEQGNIFEELQGNFKGVVAIDLPKDKDPGELSHEYIWSLITPALRKAEKDYDGQILRTTGW